MPLRNGLPSNETASELSPMFPAASVMRVRWEVRYPLDELFEKKGNVVCAGGTGPRLKEVKAIRRLLRQLEESGYRSVSIKIKPRPKKRRKE